MSVLCPQSDAQLIDAAKGQDGYLIPKSATALVHQAVACPSDTLFTMVAAEIANGINENNTRVEALACACLIAARASICGTNMKSEPERWARSGKMQSLVLREMGGLGRRYWPQLASLGCRY